MKVAHSFGLSLIGVLFSAGMSPHKLSSGYTMRPQNQASKEPVSYTEKIPGTTVSFKMIAVPAGTFRMGSPAAEKGRNADEGPLHPVALDAFWIGQHEVTWDEYELFVYPEREKSKVDGCNAAHAAVCGYEFWNGKEWLSCG